MSLHAVKWLAMSRLKAAGIEDPVREVDLLLRAVFPKGDFDEIFSAGFDAKFEAAVARRERHEPLSHISGTRAFWMSEFEVNSDVLDPRPDTETLVEAALKQPFQRVLDLGTGSGCILLSLLKERTGSTGLGVDLSAPALNVARRNCHNLGFGDRAEFRQSDWFDAVAGQFDLIVSNPPYIDAASYEGLDRGVREFEPRLALTPGETGLEAYEIILAGGPRHLTRDGWLIVEIGFDQGRSVKELFANAGYREITVLKDLTAKDRVIAAKAP